MIYVDTITCERCDEQTEPGCTHGRDLCSECLWLCRECNIEHAEQDSYDADRDEDLA